MRFSLVWASLALAVALALGACTPGGQFDPTEILSSDVFNTKKKLTGDREPLFPGGVPGAETGVPPDLMKGYQPPPEQADAAETAPPPAPKAAAEPVKPKPKPKPKPAVARAPTPSPAAQDPIWNQGAVPARSAGPSAPPQQAAQPAQPNWPAPQQSVPPQAASSAQPAWPAPPPPGQGQQTAQPSQSIWPNPPQTGAAPGTYSR